MKGQINLKGLMVGDAVDGFRDERIGGISLAPLFGEAVYRSYVGESLSDLFK